MCIRDRGCLYELHLYGGDPSFRTFIGGIPMLTSMNIAVQLRKVARLKRRLGHVPEGVSAQRS